MDDVPEDLAITHQSSAKIRFARILRKRMTAAETLLWQALRGRKCGCKFRRQVPLGIYIADFYCSEHRLIVEVDGAIHREISEHDAMRDQQFSSIGYTTIRFLNEQILHHLLDVLQEIRSACMDISSRRHT